MADLHSKILDVRPLSRSNFLQILEILDPPLNLSLLIFVTIMHLALYLVLIDIIIQDLDIVDLDVVDLELDLNFIPEFKSFSINLDDSVDLALDIIFPELKS